MPQILIVDDQRGMRVLLGDLLRDAGYAVTEAAGVADARERLTGDVFDLVLTDQRMPDGTGLDLLEFVQSERMTMPLVFMTAHGTIELAVQAMRLGAFDFLTKPFDDDVVLSVVARGLERARLMRENEQLRAQVARSVGGELIGSCPAMIQLKSRIARVAPTDAAVLVLGETGTGKELIARAVHTGSRRSDRTFIPINCAAIPAELLESTLFGHERGAFTGATTARNGLFEAASGGTLFLDEIAEMSPSLQAKLLRVLNDGEILRVGSTEPRRVDVRVVAATHRDLEKATAAGAFREDLYYRLAVVPLHALPLRDRGEDVLLLAQAFLDRAAADLKLPCPALSAAARRALLTYHWPGNVRELRNVIERACILGGMSIEPEDLGIRSGDAVPNARTTDDAASAFERWADALGSSFDLRATLAQVEERLIARVLDEAGGVRAEAARRLGISRSHMTYKLREHDSDTP